MSREPTQVELEWSSPTGDFRQWVKDRHLRIAAMAIEAAESGAEANYFKGLGEARNALKDALAVHGDIRSEQELVEMRQLRDELAALRKEFHESGGAYMGAPPPEAGSTSAH